MYIDVSNDVYNDTLIDEWMSSNVILNGSKDEIKNIIRKPLNDINKLTQRQNAINTPNVSSILYYIKECENDINWVFSLKDKDEDKDNMMNMLYPNEFYNNYISYVNEILEIYHAYKIYTLPLMQLSSPLGIILAPYMYIKKLLNMNLSINDYFQIIYKVFKFSIDTNDFKTYLIKLITFCFYIGIYLYGIWQTFDISFTLHNFRTSLLKHISGVAKFTQIASHLIDTVHQKYWIGYIDFNIDKNFIIQGNLSDVYCFWTNSFNYNNRLKNLLKIIYHIDIANTVSTLYHNENWCLTSFGNETQFFGMKNPLLLKQVDNPLSLSKNLVITGPNAAGKTTYVKSIVSNYILGQTIGICMCSKAIIKIVDIIATFMRINDIVGKRSYFEAETEYCKMMLDKAELYKNKNALFVMDEPMHSTPPTEGAATCYAVCEYIGRNYKNTKLIITTHYHSMIDIEKNNKDIFKNISMEAIEIDKTHFHFPYQIKNNFSFQCIAIELLGREKFPNQLIDTAIKIKNKLSQNIYK